MQPIRHFLCYLLPLFALTSVGQIVDPINDSEDPNIQLAFSQTPLETVLELYGELTGKSIMMSPAVAQVNITFKSREKLTDREALVAIETMLSMNNVGILPFQEKFIRVEQVANMSIEALPIDNLELEIPGNEATPGDLKPAARLEMTAEPKLQIIELKHVSFEEVQPLLQTLLHPFSKIQFIERTNSILLYDTAGNIQRILDMLKYVDRPQEFHERMYIIQIIHAVASEVKGTIDELVTQAQEDQQQTDGGRAVTNRGIPIPRANTNGRAPDQAQTPTTDISRLAEKGLVQGNVRITADDRTNQLIIRTMEENYESFIKPIIEKLDVPVDPDIGFETHRLEYADAEEVSGVLNDLIGNVTADSGTGNGNANANANANANPNGGTSISDILRNRNNPGGNTGNTIRDRAAAAIGEANLANISENTRIIADPRTNSLLITGRPEDITILRGIIEDLDIMLPQVLIEVAILEVNLNDNLNYGIDWLQRSLTVVNRETIGAAGGLEVDQPIVGFGGASRPNGGGVASADGTGSGFIDGSTVDRTLAAAAGSLSYFATFYDFNLDAVLTAAKGSSEARVLSIPQILTTDNTDASVVIGESRPIPTASSTTLGGTIRNTFEYRDIGINLELTPRINPSSVVVLEVSASADNVGGDVIIDGNNVPIITRRDLQAEVAIKDGATIVLGGLVSEDERDSESKVPILGDIPILGNLFKSVEKVNVRTELLVLITPHVLISHEAAQDASRRLHAATRASEAKWGNDWSHSEFAKELEQHEPMWRDRVKDFYSTVTKDREDMTVEDLPAISDPRFDDGQLGSGLGEFDRPVIRGPRTGTFQMPGFTRDPVPRRDNPSIIRDADPQVQILAPRRNTNPAPSDIILPEPIPRDLPDNTLNMQPAPIDPPRGLPSPVAKPVAKPVSAEGVSPPPIGLPSNAEPESVPFAIQEPVPEPAPAPAPAPNVINPIVTPPPVVVEPVKPEPAATPDAAPKRVQDLNDFRERILRRAEEERKREDETKIGGGNTSALPAKPATPKAAAAALAAPVRNLAPTSPTTGPNAAPATSEGGVPQPPAGLPSPILRR